MFHIFETVIGCVSHSDKLGQSIMLNWSAGLNDKVLAVFVQLNYVVKPHAGFANWMTSEAWQQKLALHLKI